MLDNIFKGCIDNNDSSRGNFVILYTTIIQTNTFIASFIIQSISFHSSQIRKQRGPDGKSHYK